MRPTSLVGQDNLDFQTRAPFFGVAAKSMRQILIEYARKIQTVKRGQGKKKSQLRKFKVFQKKTQKRFWPWTKL